MNINIKYFGKLVDIVDKENDIINSNALSIKELLLSTTNSIPKLRDEVFIIFVNNKKVENLNHVLSDQDVVCFMPPFSGG